MRPRTHSSGVQRYILRTREPNVARESLSSMSNRRDWTASISPSLPRTATAERLTLGAKASQVQIRREFSTLIMAPVPYLVDNALLAHMDTFANWTASKNVIVLVFSPALCLRLYSRSEGRGGYTRVVNETWGSAHRWSGRSAQRDASH